MQTLTSVGFGDIAAETSLERLFAIAWMIVGVGFFSYAIGKIVSILSNMDKRENEIKSKMRMFSESAAKINLPNFITDKVNQFFELIKKIKNKLKKNL